MHGSVLTNKKYIKFADENTVDVISMANLEAGKQAGDKRLETFKGKDAKGNEVEYLMGWPNLTLEQLSGMQVPRTWKDGNGIPDTAIVNPHTLEKFDSWKGSYSAGKLMDAVAAAKKILNKQHGKSVSRKKLRKLRKDEDKARAELDKGNVAKAMTGWRDVSKKATKFPDTVQEIPDKLLADILKVAGEQLDELEAVIGRGELKSAARSLGSLSRALKGTALEKRAVDLLTKAKASE